MAKTTLLGVVTFGSAVRLSHLPDTLVCLHYFEDLSKIEHRGNSVATRAITGVLFGLAIAIVLKSDLCITYPTFSGAMYIFSFCEFRVIFLIYTH